MVVNAPPSAADDPDNDLPRSNMPPADARVLLPGEIVLWRGQPRAGAGWRCLLRERDLQIAYCVSVLGGTAATIANGFAPGRIAVLLAVVSGIGGAGLAWRGRQLRKLRYFVTDRRAIVVGTVLNPSLILSIPHTATQPERYETRCGTTITLGQGVVGNAAFVRWQRKTSGIGRLFAGPGHDSPQVVFRALEPQDAPFGLLFRLAGSVGGLARGPVPPLMGGFQQ